ncbi:MAG: dihydroorotase [Bacteroidaceae bacterium]|nr:dihydroorotase [Bacteroidaceae bacterium]
MQKKKVIIKGAVIVSDGQERVGDVLIRDGVIQRISNTLDIDDDDVIDAHDCYLLPGIIDDHVHFREPGLTDKADMHTESMSAVAGGVTSVLDMPNVVPQTTSFETWEQRMQLAEKQMHCNYGFFIGATNSNMDEILKIPVERYPGVKLFMGSSTGNMLVDRKESLMHIFRNSPKIIMVHCEDTAIINRNMQIAREQFGDDPDIIHHPEIRSREACIASSSLAVKMARETCARLHIAHISTAEELEFLDKADFRDNSNETRITGEACVAHLIYTQEDYRRLGAKIKCNPAIKHNTDREALRKALTDGRIAVVGTDHAPHLLSDKTGGARTAASGIPMIQFSLISMLELVEEGILPLTRLVELMCHNPAKLFGIQQRGFIREGMYADLVLVRRTEPYRLSKDVILSKCGWSPRENDDFHWKVCKTLISGNLVYDGKNVDTAFHGNSLIFS